MHPFRFHWISPDFGELFAEAFKDTINRAKVSHCHNSWFVIVAEELSSSYDEVEQYHSMGKETPWRQLPLLQFRRHRSRY